MRMRKKKNLDQRLESCGQRIIFMVNKRPKQCVIKDTENLINYKTLFKNDNPVELEIGCGDNNLQERLLKETLTLIILQLKKAVM